MEGWKSERLGDLFETGSGTTPLSTNAIYYEGNTNWLLTGDLNDGIIRDTSKKVSDKALKDYSTLKMYPKRSVVIALYGATIGKLGFLDIESTTNQACCVLFNSQKMHQDYLFYNLLFSKNRILALAVGGGQPNISQNIVKNFVVSFPSSLKEQQKIATILSTIDSSIVQTEQLIAKYKNIKQGLIHDLLTYGIDENGTIRKPQTHTFIEKNGMMVPIEWEVVSVDDILELLTDFDANGSFADMKENVNISDGEGYAWYVRATDLENNTQLNKVKYVDEKSYFFLRKSYLVGGEVLFAKRGEIGKVYRVPKLNIKMTLAPNTYLLRLNKKAYSEFVYYYFISHNGKQALIDNNASTTLGIILPKIRTAS